MEVIFMPQHQIWKMLHCAHILNLSIHFHTGNVYCDAVMTVHVSIFLTKKQLKKHEEKTPSIRFHIYHIIARCAIHGRLSLKDKNICSICKQEYSPNKSTEIYTRKELVTMETTISDFHTSFYIPAIQKLAFHLPHVRILEKNHCGELRCTAFKRFKMYFVAVIMQKG